jgi:hypothetical protein
VARRFVVRLRRLRRCFLPTLRRLARRYRFQLAGGAFRSLWWLILPKQNRARKTEKKRALSPPPLSPPLGSAFI